MLASYGYVHTPSGDVSNKDNKAIPNMNNPFGYSWLPNRRSSSNGLINLPHGAVKIANNANYMIMATGNNPTTGGIDQYAFVYRIFLRRNPYIVTFLNHNRYNGGQQGRMHVTKFVVEALKGESGTYVRFALGEALGVTWSDSYPTGYGFSDENAPFSTFNKEFFLSQCAFRIRIRTYVSWMHSDQFPTGCTGGVSSLYPSWMVYCQHFRENRSDLNLV